MRKQLIHILFLFCFLISLKCMAQTQFIKPGYAPSLFKHYSLLSFSHNLNITQTQPVQGSFPIHQQTYNTEIKSGSINDMPFFCAMECRLHGRTGLWIKLRTGDDASYEKLIHSTEK